MDIVIVCTLLVIGIVFFLVELFLLPGISIAGIVGLLFTGASIYYAYAFVGATAGTITLVGGIILFSLAVWWFMRSKALDKMTLKTDIDGKVDPLQGLDIQVGDKGKTMSRLAPMGKVRINGAVVEAKTNDDFIDPNEEVIVLEVYKTNVLVERAEKNS
ncbi:hypothetical protein D0T49_09875 [Paludibacter sp. 221]|uniref:NfeD family protein n=1 Tax=Paludibacter sp. 221 TaxID=2302939 RepID=UPI0013D8D71E|nr:NfeD family protein [Paludibacter sp. 221]NDV47352.1 hypothetical protein [Paludibacter sp. 221]